MVFQNRLIDSPESSSEPSASTLVNESYFLQTTKTNAGDPSDKSGVADKTAIMAAGAYSNEQGGSETDPADQPIRKYIHSVDQTTNTRTEILRELNPLSANPVSLQLDQLELGLRDGFSHRLDNFSNPDTRTEAIAETGISLTGAAVISTGLVRLAHSAPEAARSLGKVFKYALLADVAYELGSAAYAGFQTWKHPEDYLQNSSRVAETLDPRVSTMRHSLRHPGLAILQAN